MEMMINPDEEFTVFLNIVEPNEQQIHKQGNSNRDIYISLTSHDLLSFLAKLNIKEESRPNIHQSKVISSV